MDVCSCQAMLSGKGHSRKTCTIIVATLKTSRYAAQPPATGPTPIETPIETQPKLLITKTYNLID